MLVSVDEVSVLEVVVSEVEVVVVRELDVSVSEVEVWKKAGQAGSNQANGRRTFVSLVLVSVSVWLVV